MERTPLETRKQIFVLHLKGYSQRDIAKKLGVALGTVSNVLKDFNDGLYPELVVPEEEIVFIRKMGTDIRKSGKQLWQVFEAMTFLDLLREWNVQRHEYKDFIPIMEALKSGDLSIDTISNFLIRAHAMEEETGIPIERLQPMLSDIQIKISEGKAELDNIGKEKIGLRSEVESLKQERASIRKDNSASKQRVSELIATEDYLKEYGVNNVVTHVKGLKHIMPKGSTPGDIPVLYEIKKAVEAAGWPEDKALEFMENMFDNVELMVKREVELTTLEQKILYLSQGLTGMSDLFDIAIH